MDVHLVAPADKVAPFLRAQRDALAACLDVPMEVDHEVSRVFYRQQDIGGLLWRAFKRAFGPDAKLVTDAWYACDRDTGIEQPVPYRPPTLEESRARLLRGIELRIAFLDAMLTWPCFTAAREHTGPS